MLNMKKCARCFQGNKIELNLKILSEEQEKSV